MNCFELVGASYLTLNPSVVMVTLIWTLLVSVLEKCSGWSMMRFSGSLL